MSITWKRKRENKVLKEQQKLFQENVAEDEDELLNSDEIDWLHPSKRRCLVLEDSNTKSERLKNEGCLLAEQGRLVNFHSQFKFFAIVEVIIKCFI